jgi:predicted ribosome quality control (RQC) complex YloA/Tae2 family protein
MFFDTLTMACVVDELRDTVLHGRIQQVLLPDQLSVGLEIYAQGQRHYLLASAHSERGSVHLASEKLRRGVDKETGLLLLLRKLARGARISALEQPPFERILRLEFEHPQRGCHELVIEIMGRHSNVMLVDAAGRILDAVKRVPPTLSPRRPVLPGQPYMPPPPQAKLPPSDLTEYRLREILAEHEPEMQVWRALVQGVRGMSPLLAREIAYRSLGHPRASISQVERIALLLNSVHELFAPLSTGQWQPTLVWQKDQLVAYAPYLLTHHGDPKPFPSMSQAIATYAADIVSADPYAAAKRPVQEALAAARKRLDRQREALERPLLQASEADQWRQWGEWILAYAHTISPGQSELVVDTLDGEVIIVPLSPEASAVDNAQAYFARYRKAQRAAEGGPARLQELGLALRDLEQLEVDLQLAASRPQIDAVLAALAEAGYIKRKRRRALVRGSDGPLSLVSPDGLPILIGRNSRQNDEVTFRRAGSNDWWFHARGVPGAHVIVRGSGGGSLPPDTIQRAAELAAYYSKLRDDAKVPVDYTRRRYVKRIRGAAPGLVTYRREQTIRVVPCGPVEDET